LFLPLDFGCRFNLLDTGVDVVAPAAEDVLSVNCHRRLLSAPLVAPSPGSAEDFRGAIVAKI